MDSAFIYTQMAIEYDKKYNKEFDYNEAILTKGILLANSISDSNLTKDYIEDINQYYLSTIPFWVKTNNYPSVSTMFVNIAKNYLKVNDLENALKYSDSSYAYYVKAVPYYKFSIPDLRRDIFAKMEKYDSAYNYLVLAIND